jgi:hypothetical protein
MGVAAVVLAGPGGVKAIAEGAPVPVGMAQVQLARAISSALGATVLVLAARIGSRAAKAMAGVLLDL